MNYRYSSFTFSRMKKPLAWQKNRFYGFIEISFKKGTYFFNPYFSFSAFHFLPHCRN